MLAELHIENLGVIREMTLEFDNGFCVITGETGAGKSLLVGAIKLVIGERGGVDKIFPGANYLRVDARFMPSSEIRQNLSQMGIDGDEIIISRKITSDGKSSFWINNVPSAAEKVRKMGEFLVDLHGQHSHQALLNQKMHVSFLDKFAGTEKLAESVSKLFQEYSIISQKVADMCLNKDEELRRQRMLRFELEELTNSMIRPGELEELTETLELLESAEQVVSFGEKLVAGSVEGANSISEIAGNLLNELSRVPHVPNADQIVELLKSIIASADELRILGSHATRVEFNPQKADEIRNRIFFLNDLTRKYGKSIDELIAYRDKLSSQLIDVLNIDELILQTEEKAEQTRCELEQLAQELSKKRSEKAKELSERIEYELGQLGMSNAKFVVDLGLIPESESIFSLNGTSHRLFSTGFEQVQFLISANPGHPPMPLTKIASGGELSRIALALGVVIPQNENSGTSVFDEIDTAVSGITAMRVAERLKKLSEKRQVIAITHLYPVARLADQHWVLEKKLELEKTEVTARHIVGKEREKELMRLSVPEKLLARQKDKYLI